MRRLSNEDGIDAGVRNFGRYMLAAIPAALGGAALLWITAAFGWIDLTREIRLRERAAEAVGATAPPTAPVRLVTHDAACLKVEASRLDGKVITFYARNTCQRWLENPTFSYRVKAPDGTSVESARWAFDGDRKIGPSERREEETSFDVDDRISEIELWVIDGA